MPFDLSPAQEFNSSAQVAPNTYVGPIGPSRPGNQQGTADNVTSGGAYTGPIGPSSPGFVQGTANNVAITSDGSGGGGTPGGGIQTGEPSAPNYDSLFNPVFDVLNQAESNLRGQLPGLISEAEQQANLSRNVLTGGRDEQTQLLNQQSGRVRQSGQKQTADQRQILQELTQANQQRFGGASSAGQAASELQGREFQRNRFQIQQNVEQGLQQIANQIQAVEREFQNGLQQIELNRQQAVNEINRRFQDKLLEINSRRADTEQAKQQARLEALQTLRNEAFQINVAKAQFESDLNRQYQANSQYLSQAQQDLLNFGQTGVAAGDQVAGFQASGIPSVSGAGTTNTPQLTGQISDDEFVGQISPTFNRDPRLNNFQSFA